MLGGSDKCDALAIAAAYQRKYTTVLKDGIKKECSGNYKRLAQAWVTLPDALEDPEAPIDVIADTQSEPDGDGAVDDPDPPTPPASPKTPPPTQPPPVWKSTSASGARVEDDAMLQHERAVKF